VAGLIPSPGANGLAEGRSIQSCGVTGKPLLPCFPCFPWFQSPPADPFVWFVWFVDKQEAHTVFSDFRARKHLTPRLVSRSSLFLGRPEAER
jgi:hypothetical protein